MSSPSLFLTFSRLLIPQQITKDPFLGFGPFVLCVDFQSAKVLLRSGIQLWLDLTQPLVH